MADYRRHYDEEPRRHERDWADRSSDEVRSWFGDDQARQGRGNDERDDRFPYAGHRSARHEDWRTSPEGYREDRTSRWEAPREDRDSGGFGNAGASTGAYRSDDRGYHDRYRAERARQDGPSSPRSHFANGHDAADEYYRAAREQRDDYMRWEARSPGAEFEDGPGRTHGVSVAPWARRERGGYWRTYEPQAATYSGRGPKNYQRSDDRVREEICDCMTDDPLLDASEITVEVNRGEVILSGSVTSRDQKRRAEDVAERISGVKDVTNQLRVSREANGHSHTAAPPVTQASGNGTPSKSTSRTTT
jgi:hypothetical protein